MTIVKRLLYTLLGIAIILGAYFAYSNSPLKKSNQTVYESTKAPVVVDPIKSLIEEMTPEEKIGQLFLVGTFEQNSNRILEKLISEKYIGSVILLGPNIQNINTANFINRLQAIAASTSQKFPLLISVDQEGGVVARIKAKGSDLTAQSEIKTTDQAYEVAFRRGSELKSLGINVNFSPVLDYIMKSTSFLFNRSFRGTEVDFISYGSSMIEGYEEAGLVSTIKHYPGHDETSVDSHKDLPIADIGEEDFPEYIKVFTEVIKLTPPSMVMTAHVFFPQIDSEYPATLSPKIIGILRNDYKYDGVIITDDMNMGAITKNFGLEFAALQAIRAGNDILLYVATQENIEKAYDSLLLAYKDGVISSERINESVYRVLKLKSGLQ